VKRASRRWRSLAPLLAGIGAACAGVARPEDWYTKTPPPPGAFAATGPCDAMAIDGIWGVGDQVVYTVDVDDAGTHHGFTFTLTTTKLPPSDPDRMGFAHPMHGRVLTYTCEYDWQLNPVCYEGRGQATMRAELCSDDGTHCSGEFEAEAFAHRFVDDIREGINDGVQPLFAGLLGLDCLHATLLRVIRAPSAWSVVRNFGRITIGLDWHRIEHLEFVDEATPFGVLPTAWLPITISANGQAALDGRIQFTWKRPPLLLSAGVLQIEAWHPDDAKRRLTARLASARRGTPADIPDERDLGLGVKRGMTIAEVFVAWGVGGTKLHTRGKLADGRIVELLEFDMPATGLFGVLHEGTLIFASGGDELSRDFLQRRGFVPEPRDR
jgi:hypothetical protein